MKKIKRYLKIMLIALTVTIVLARTSFAYLDLGTSNLSPNPNLNVANSYNINTLAGGNYQEAVNSYNEAGTKYYLITSDTARLDSTLPDYKKVTKDGVSYTVEEVLYDAGTAGIVDLQEIKVSTDLNLSIIDPSNNYKDRTYFFDNGHYRDSNPHNYTGFNKENVSWVALENEQVTLSKAPVESNTILRYNLSLANIYFEGIVFDAEGNGMPSNTNPYKHRGEYLFMLTTGSSNFVMKNSVIKNLNGTGASSGFFSPRKNVAINMYKNVGPVNLENIRFENNRIHGGYSMIALNEATNVNMRNLDIDMSLSTSPISMPIKVEDYIDRNRIQHNINPVVEAKDIVVNFDQININDASFDRGIYIQDFRYLINLDPEWQFSGYKVENGGRSRFSSLISKTLKDPASGIARLDLRDYSWIAEEAKSISLSDQIQATLQLWDNDKYNQGLDRLPKDIIKVIGDSNSEVDSFDVNIGSSYNYRKFEGKSFFPGSPLYYGEYSQTRNLPGLDLSLNLIARTHIDKLYTDSDSHLKVKATAKLRFNQSLNNKDLFLHNFDFHSLGKKTFHHATLGIAANPAHNILAQPQSLYYIDQAGSELSSKLSEAVFKYDRFTVLQKELEASPEAVPCGNFKIIAKVLESYTDQGVSTTQTQVDDSSYSFTLDPASTSFADIDANGNVTVKADGQITVTVKVLDQNNQGEFLKPEIVLRNIPVKICRVNLSFDANGGSNSPATMTQVINTVFNEPSTNPQRPGYSFIGWYQDAAGSLPFDFSQALSEDKIAYAKWQKDETSSTSTKATSTQATSSSTSKIELTSTSKQVESASTETKSSEVISTGESSNLLGILLLALAGLVLLIRPRS